MGDTTRISDYVNGTNTAGEDNFTADQKTAFNFLMSSFPEKLRAINNGEELVEYEDVVAVLAMMAYIIGDARKYINNLQHIKDVPYLFENSDGVNDDDPSLTETNKTLLLLNSLDLGSSVLDESLTVGQQIELIENDKRYFLNAYEYVKNRGTLATIESVIKDYLLANLPAPPEETGKVAEPNSKDAADFSISTLGNGYLIQIEQTVDEDADPTNNYTGNYNHLKEESLLYKIIQSIRPAGVLFTIVMLQKLNVLENLLTPVVTTTHSDNSHITIPGPTTAVPIVTNADYGIYVSETEPLTYNVTIENPSDYIAYVCRIKDYAVDTYDDDDRFSVHHEVLLGPGETRTYTLSSFNSYTYEAPVYIAVHFSVYSVGYGSYNTANAGSSFLTPDTPPPATLETPTLNAEKKSSYAGGYVELTINNNNAAAVSAKIDYLYSLGILTEGAYLTRAVPGNGSITINIYNPYSDPADFSVDVHFEANGYTNSAKASTEVTGVTGTRLAA